MPDGVVQWFDEAEGEGRIVRKSREYPVTAADSEPAARRAGARVHFDVDRRGGVEVAADVRLRAGTRVSHRQGRFGSLAGARRPDAKAAAPFARPHPELGHDLATHPGRVAEAWAEAIAGKDVEGAMVFYAPGAVVHTPDAVLSGPSALRAHLESSPLQGLGHPVASSGGDDVVELRWDHPQGPPTEVFVAVRHGEIAEQWVDGAAPDEVARERAPAPPAIDVVVRGEVPNAAVAYAREKVARMASLLDEPLLHARLKLTRLADPAVKRPVLAQANLDVNGELVRAHVRGHEPWEAADLLERRLRDRLEHRSQHRQDRDRGLPPEPGTWRRGDRPTERASYYPRPPEEREVVRHKTLALGELTPDEAAFDMEVLDYDFYLFTDLASGEDSALWRSGDGGYVLERLHPAPAPPTPVAVPLRVREGAAPVLDVAQAVERLNAGEEPFLFFEEAGSRRGEILYHRYDGHYGLITPSAD